MSSLSCEPDAAAGRPARCRTVRRRPVALTIVIQLVAVLAFASAMLGLGSGHAQAAVVPAGLHVSGNQLLTSSGTPVVVRGVNRSGTEYQCIHNNGIFEGPNTDTSISAMAAWHINTVRVPLNEDCWLGINNAPAAYSGAAYRSAITDYVTRLHAVGLMVVLDLHWTAAGTAQSTDPQKQMPDADHAPAFWVSVATTFKSDTSTMFDLFNEPYGISWACWRDGGDCGLGYQVAGMQSLVNAVRSTGATNPVLLGGLSYANDLSSWLAYRPSDPAGAEVASWHSYGQDGTCNSTSCWNAQLAPVIAAVPLVTGELGEYDCAHSYIDGAMAWLDAHRAGYLGWGWDTTPCGSFPALISSYDGTPTAFGIGLRDHLAALAASNPPAGASAGPTPSAGPSSPAPGCPTTMPSSTPPTSTPPSTGGSLSASPSANTSSAPYWWENDLSFSASAPITKLTVTVSVTRTAGITYAGVYSNGPSGALTLGHTDSTAAVTYTATLAPGSTLPANTSVVLGSQFNGNGSAHATSGDSYQISAVVGGQTMTGSGHF